MANKWFIKEVLKQERDDMSDLLDIAAAVMVAEIQNITPVDTGNLRSNTTWEQKSKLVRRVFNNTEYAVYVEFGTGRKAEDDKGNKDIAGQDPQPYFRPGVKAATPKIKKILK